MAKLSGYQAGGSSAQALVGAYIDERSRRLAYWYLQLEVRRARRDRDGVKRAKRMIETLTGGK
jgi:hypothetical protein